jgi:tripartite ATP-independent transporter DctM subunit
MMIAVAIVLLVVLLLVGVPVPFSFLGSVLVFIFAGGYDPSFLLPYGYSKMNNVVILAIPMFIMAGGLINRAHIGDKLIGIAELLVGRLRSGVGAISIVSCAMFGAVTGSACATLSAIGSIMFPRMKDAGYPQGHSAALMASASVLGMLIPPSAIMILYAWVGQVSVLACFLSSVLPGIILATLLCLVNAFLLRKHANIKVMPPMLPAVFRRELLHRTWTGLPALSMPILVLGGIYGGICTPTEAAALSAVWALPLGFFVYRRLTVRGALEELKEAIITTGAIMLMLYCIMVLSRIYIMEGLPAIILSGMTAVSKNPIVILIMINIFIIIIGMLMDDVSAVLLITPLLVPIVIKLGMSPIHFAAVVGVNLGMGNITPPTAPVLYFSTQLNGADLAETLRPMMIMIIFAWLPCLLLTTYMPGLALWLPELILGRKF